MRRNARGRYTIGMRHLGIDYGEKRIGIAVSDPNGQIAFPRKVFFNRGNPRLLSELVTLIEEEKVSKVIVGLPVSLDGRETGQTKVVREFAESLEKEVAIPVEFENEMLTTRMAEQAGIKKEHTDEAAAALILQAYLDRINK